MPKLKWSDSIRRVLFTGREVRFLKRLAYRNIEALKEEIQKNDGDHRLAGNLVRLKQTLANWESISASLEQAEDDRSDITQDEVDDFDPEE